MANCGSPNNLSFITLFFMGTSLAAFIKNKTTLLSHANLRSNVVDDIKARRPDDSQAW
jgi:hypothetical protein